MQLVDSSTETKSSLIPAIRKYRERTGASLPEAKRETERYRDNPGAYALEVAEAEGEKEKIREAVQQIGDLAEVYEAVNAPLLRQSRPSFSSRRELVENHRLFRDRVTGILVDLLGSTRIAESSDVG
jgi:hypothetical protein